MKATSATAAAAAVMLVSGAALAADPPDLVGTWKSVPGTYASARVGDANDHHPEHRNPVFGSPDQVWSIVIDEQQGRAFHGKAVSPRGSEESVVGVISFDGQRLTMAGNEAGLFGTILGDQIEFCYQDHDDDLAGVACYVAEKQ